MPSLAHHLFHHLKKVRRAAEVDPDEVLEVGYFNGRDGARFCLRRYHYDVQPKPNLTPGLTPTLRILPLPLISQSKASPDPE